MIFIDKLFLYKHFLDHKFVNGNYKFTFKDDKKEIILKVDETFFDIYLYYSKYNYVKLTNIPFDFSYPESKENNYYTYKIVKEYIDKVLDQYHNKYNLIALAA